MVSRLTRVRFNEKALWWRGINSPFPLAAARNESHVSNISTPYPTAAEVLNEVDRCSNLPIGIIYSGILNSHLLCWVSRSRDTISMAQLEHFLLTDRDNFYSKVMLNGVGSVQFH